MNWIRNNLVGAMLLGTSGLLVLLGLGLTLFWGRAPESVAAAAGDADTAKAPEVVRIEPLGDLGDYDIVNERPVFNEGRRPVAVDVEAPVDEAEPEIALEVADPPKVRLTGVVITPEARFVTLTPEAGGEALVLRQGAPLEGEFVGWSVDGVEPRKVSLRSDAGEQFSVEMTVYDAMIERPPEPEPPPAVEEEAPGEVAAEEGEVSEEVRSRADEIRERIRQRREQLREEAAQEEADEAGDRASTRNAYQDAIRNLMMGNRPDEEDGGDEEEDGDE